MSEPIISISGGIATITLNRPNSLNALTITDYDAFANALREIDKREDVVITVWQAVGKWFSAGTNVKGRALTGSAQSTADFTTLRGAFLRGAAHSTTDCGHALSSHSKILVAALNGPVMGISASFLGHFDFIYCMPNAWLSLPFTFLGLAAEGGSSVSFVNRMGLAKANEVLLWGQKKGAQELLECGFVNKIFPQQPAEQFHETIRGYLQQQLSGLDPSSLLSIRKLIRTGIQEKNDFDAVNLRESYAQAERYASGIPAEQFRRIAAKEIRHKL